MVTRAGKAGPRSEPGASGLERSAAWLRSPAATFLVVGLVAGVLSCVLVPSFAGIDEPEHFARTYQVSEGRLLPVSPPAGADGVGACLPGRVRDEVAFERSLYWFGSRVSQGDLDSSAIPCGGAGSGGRFVEFATFSWYSPLGYAPQAVGVGLARLVTDDATVMLLVGRLALLLAYVTIVWFAIRRTPTGKWAIAVVALLPIALLQGATSVSPDALATALTMLVLATALRACDRSVPFRRRRYLIEATAFGLALGLTKPTYVLVTLAFFLPLTMRSRRPAPPGVLDMAVPPVVALGVSSLWYRWRQPEFVCDVRHFGMAADPGGQIHDIITGPQRLVGGLVRGTVDNLGTWTTQLVLPGQQVLPDWLIPGGLPLALALLAVFAVVGAQRTGDETLALPLLSRVSLLVLFVVGIAALLAGWFVYCSPVGFDMSTSIPHARLFVPFLALPAVALAPTGARARSLASTRVPVALGAVAIWGFLVVELIRRGR